jgi:hypothetical protein
MGNVETISLSPAQKWPSMYNACPSCGGDKNKTSKVCRKCYNPNAIQTPPGSLKLCTQCGEVKDGVHRSWCKKCVVQQIKDLYAKDPVVREERKARSSKYKKEHRDESRDACQKYRKRMRSEVIAKLGGRCSSPTCMWMNDDGSLGCDDPYCLQIDHVEAGGLQDRKRFSHRISFYRHILAGADGYQLLCANCNWRKRYDNAEYC